MKPLNGNSNDNKEFREIIRAFAKNLQDVEGVETFVADSALYSKETVELMHENNVKFVTRVPTSVARVGELIELGTSGKKELCNLGCLTSIKTSPRVASFINHTFKSPVASMIFLPIG